MACWRCGTCHSLYMGTQIAFCNAAKHEEPYDDEA